VRCFHDAPGADRHLEPVRRAEELPARCLRLALERIAGLILLTAPLTGTSRSSVVAGRCLGFPTSAIGRPPGQQVRWSPTWVFCVARGLQWAAHHRDEWRTEEGWSRCWCRRGAVAVVATRTRGARGVRRLSSVRKAGDGTNPSALVAMEFFTNGRIVIRVCAAVERSFQFLRWRHRNSIFPRSWKSRTKPLPYLTQAYTKGDRRLFHRRIRVSYWWCIGG